MIFLTKREQTKNELLSRPDQLNVLRDCLRLPVLHLVLQDGDLLFIVRLSNTGLLTNLLNFLLKYVDLDRGITQV